MKICITFLRIDLDDGSYYRLAVHRHYESGEGVAGMDPRALAAAAYGTIAQNVHVILAWAPFDFGVKGGLILDPQLLADAMEENDSDGRVREAIKAAREQLTRLACLLDPISEGVEPKPDPGL